MRNQLHNRYMSNRLRTETVYTMDDLATELGLSKSTVSRALSGSGRIGAATVARVKAHAAQRGFRPNLAAKALAVNKSFNIAAIMPREATAAQMLFFHECLSGMVTRAAEDGYCVLVCMIIGDETEPVEDVLRNRKADAFVLTQLRHEDTCVALLHERNIPFVVIGSGAGNDIVQVDSRMAESCAEFTRLCTAQLAEGSRVLFVCGSLDVEANNNRLSGFLNAMEAAALQYAICTDVDDLAGDTDLASWNLILCSDDVVCIAVFELLKQMGRRIGSEVLLASFHDSVLLESLVPAVSAQVVLEECNVMELGSTAAALALAQLAGGAYERLNYVDCSFQMRESTGTGR